MSFSGPAEFARQWSLISRTERYEEGSGRHNLCLAAGGNAGQGGCWHIQVDEGQIDDEFNGRTWDVTVQTRAEAMATTKDEKQ